MSLFMSSSSLALWQETIQHAESQCAIALKKDLESYLVHLLDHYSHQPELAKRVLATAFLEAMSMTSQQVRFAALREMGDHCLLYAGLFPKTAEKKHVKISYFVQLGQSAYTLLSRSEDDLFADLALQFVALMDVLQSIRSDVDLLPLEAYEQWQEVGSQRALRLLRLYTEALPIKNLRG